MLGDLQMPKKNPEAEMNCILKHRHFLNVLFPALFTNNMGIPQYTCKINIEQEL